MTYPIETLKDALRFSLAQWKMYSDTRSGTADDLDTADTPEGKEYRRCKAALDVQPECPRRPPYFEQFEECDNCPDCDCGTLIDVSFTPYVVACDNCGRLFCRLIKK